MSQATTKTDAYDPATQPLRPDRSLGELFGEMTADISTLFRKELELAKVEAKDEATRVGKGAGMFAGAGVAGWLALLFLSLALAWLLDQAMNTALAFALVGVVWALAALVLVMRAKRELKDVQPLPTTVQTVKEDVQWAKEQKS
ncbi:MAG: hypothetical protein JWM12_2789 [Ilumatobacteraceae bacterium]|jgi:uncharacterized membrane protein YqjE|nr:hypothetical protein [Ilumatobacteraceae bacterium]